MGPGCFSEAIVKLHFEDWRVMDATVTRSVQMSVPALATASGRIRWSLIHTSEGWIKGIVRDSIVIIQATPLTRPLACPV